MNRKLFVAFFWVVYQSLVLAQPTFKTGEFRFRAFSPSGEVLFQAKNAEVSVDWLDKSATPPGPFIKRDIFQFESGYFYYQPMMSPYGGIIAPDIYFQIVHQKDTMRLFGINKFNKEMAVIDSIPFSKGDFYLEYDLLPLLNILPLKSEVICDFSWEKFRQWPRPNSMHAFAPHILYGSSSPSVDSVLSNVQNESTYNVMNKADKLEVLMSNSEVVVTNLSAATTVYSYAFQKKELIAFDFPAFNKSKNTCLLLKENAEACYQLGVLPINFQPHLIFYQQEEWLSLATTKMKSDVLPEVTGIFKLTEASSMATADSMMLASNQSFFKDSIAALVFRKKEAENLAWQAMVDSLTTIQTDFSKLNPKFFEKPVRLILANTDTFATLTLIDSLFTLTVYRSNSNLANMGFAVRKQYTGRYKVDGNYLAVEFQENARIENRQFYIITTKKQFRMIDQKTKKSLLFNRVKRLY